MLPGEAARWAAICTCLLLMGTLTWREALWPHSSDYQVPSHGQPGLCSTSPHWHRLNVFPFHTCPRAVHHIAFQPKCQVEPWDNISLNKDFVLEYFRRGLIVKAGRSKCNSVCHSSVWNVWGNTECINNTWLFALTWTTRHSLKKSFRDSSLSQQKTDPQGHQFIAGIRGNLAVKSTGSSPQEHNKI